MENSDSGMTNNHVTSHTTRCKMENMAKWQIQEAKARFSELLNAALKHGPQIVTRRGVEEAVLVPMNQWRRLQRERRPTIKELLLCKEPRSENIEPKRRRWNIRSAVHFK